MPRRRRVPFALCSLFLWNPFTRERVKEARRRLLYNPGSRSENCRFAVPSAYSSRLPGRARRSLPASHALNPHPCGFPRPYGNTSAIFSRTLPHLTTSAVCWHSLPDGGYALSGLRLDAHCRPDKARCAAIRHWHAKRIFLKRCRWSGVKIDEPLTADRVRTQGSVRRGRPAGMQARPRPDSQTTKGE